MAIQVYLNFDGNTKEVVEYYAEVFETEKPNIMLFGDVPGDPGFPMTEDVKNRVLHAEIKLNDSVIMFSDTLPGMEFVVGNNVILLFNGKSEDEIRTRFQRIAAAGKVTMELQETFWSKCYGAVTDKYGVNWMFSLATE